MSHFTPPTPQTDYNGDGRIDQNDLIDDPEMLQLIRDGEQEERLEEMLDRGVDPGDIELDPDEASRDADYLDDEGALV